MGTSGRSHALPLDSAYRCVRGDAPWSGGGRFDCGPPTVYLSRTSQGALAEYFRRHPELLPYQERFNGVLFELNFDGIHDGLGVHTEDKAQRVGIPWDRLRSSDLRRHKRYQECQALASEVVDEGGHTIIYPSAAHEGVTNVVTFGDGGEHWTLTSQGEIERPYLDPSMVRALPLGADP